jgi:hypothetical protein
MSRNRSIARGEALDNGQLPAGDAREPDAGGDATFDPDALEPTGPTREATDPDPFHPESLRLTQDLLATIGVKKALLSVPVRKPDRSWFVRVHPDENYRLQTAVIELKEERETYLIDRRLWPDLATEATFSLRALFTAVNRQGVVFLWPVRLPGPDGRVDEWSRTALESVQLAMRNWTRVVANMALGGYEAFQATGQLPEPEWPDLPLQELLRIAFKDRRISTLDDPLLRRLRGEA